MQKLALAMIVIVCSVEYFVDGDKWQRMRLLPGPFSFLPEITGAIVVVLVIVLGIQNRFRFVRPAYWIVFGFLALTIAASAAANNLEPGPLFAGLRNYLRGIPWFFAAAVFAFSERDVRVQLKLLLLICLVQVPIAIEQRIQTAVGHRRFGIEAVTGDWTSGTLLQSGTLSLFLVSAACVLAALAFRKILRMRHFALLFLLVLLPTMINETKVTILLLPLALALTFMHAVPAAARLKHMLIAGGLFALFLTIFVPVYDKLTENREYGVPLSEYFVNPDYTMRYLFTNSDVGFRGEVGRGDAITVAARDTMSDPVRAVLGLGIGNASDSALGEQFSGRYSVLYQPFIITGFSRMVLELGYLGFGLVALLHWLVFKDARAVAARAGGLKGGLAAAWTGVTVIAFLSLFYTTTEVFASLTFLFWYFAGLVAAERMRLAAAAEPRAGAVAAAAAAAAAAATAAAAPAGNSGVAHGAAASTAAARDRSEHELPAPAR